MELLAGLCFCILTTTSVLADGVYGALTTGLTTPVPKQTVFNDQNYTPKGAINLVDAREWGTAEPYEQTRKRQEEQKIMVIGEQNRPEDWICSYFGKDGSLRKRDCKSRYQLNNRNSGR